MIDRTGYLSSDWIDITGNVTNVACGDGWTVPVPHVPSSQNSGLQRCPCRSPKTFLRSSWTVQVGKVIPPESRSELIVEQTGDVRLLELVEEIVKVYANFSSGAPSVRHARDHWWRTIEHRLQRRGSQALHKFWRWDGESGGLSIQTVGTSQASASSPWFLWVRGFRHRAGFHLMLCRRESRRKNFEVVRSIRQDCVQRADKKVVDVPVSHIQVQIDRVVNVIPPERFLVRMFRLWKRS